MGLLLFGRFLMFGVGIGLDWRLGLCRGCTSWWEFGSGDGDDGIIAFEFEGEFGVDIRFDRLERMPPLGQRNECVV